ncbi:carbon-nitrogen hydrolase family protein [Marinobacter zhejiangensis]|uniref:Nitrilase n=1 Tax=Marinobacter zhejiangensis TaxID=488535 RepID=A0A1I4P0V7_9GAMM|nr:carbon-nitrogen hydrolase family protein [Marinobacter zhejiangensis]SFM21388.1 nitrilase [Marinobacter zhejiangensis]
MANVALVQQAPIVLNKTDTLSLAVDIIADLASQGTELIVFPEAFIPGYPAWIWRLRPGGDWGTCEALHTRLLRNSVSVGAGDLDPLMAAARKHQVTVVCGFSERDPANSQSTLFNSVIVIGPDGAVINHHRKLMPTNPERMVWGFGDASGLNVVDTPAGKLGTLVCWENYMPLARYALYAQGIEVYIAPTYDSGEGWIGTLQHIAREGRCWVLGCGVALERSDLPRDLPELQALYPQEETWINPGDSVVIAPGGEIVAGPLSNQKGYVTCEIDSSQAAAAKRALDITGHYSRPDLFTLEVDKRAQRSLVITKNLS